MSQKGEFSIGFTGDMKFPDEWYQKFEADKVLKAASLARGEKRLLKGAVGGDTLPKFGVKKTNGDEDGVNEESIIIEEITSKKVTFKINFPNPSIISLGDQVLRDEVTFDLQGALIGQNGLPLNTDNLLALEGEQRRATLSIQPMVDENSTEI